MKELEEIASQYNEFFIDSGRLFCRLSDMQKAELYAQLLLYDNTLNNPSILKNKSVQSVARASSSYWKILTKPGRKVAEKLTDLVGEPGRSAAYAAGGLLTGTMVAGMTAVIGKYIGKDAAKAFTGTNIVTLLAASGKRLTPEEAEHKVRVYIGDLEEKYLPKYVN